MLSVRPHTGVKGKGCVMEPTDLVYLVVVIVALGMIMTGATIPTIGFLLWVGCLLVVGLGVMWAISLRHRHGPQH